MNVHFDPDAPGLSGNLFGLPYTPDNSSLVIIPVPWEVTATYGSGSSRGPQAVLDASAQIDHGSIDFAYPWKTGISMLPISDAILRENDRLRFLSQKEIARQQAAGNATTGQSIFTEKVNEGCENLNVYIKSKALKFLRAGKFVGVLGGDHSVSLGLIRALAEVHSRFGILQIDAHADLRNGYEGFVYSHASIMHNALQLDTVERLVQVGIRDVGVGELQAIHQSGGRIKTIFDRDIKESQYNGVFWGMMCNQIVKQLPDLVYVSFDIDGLDPKLCPNTGTPVPGGLEFEQTVMLLRKIVQSGRKIIGFDLCEVAPGKTNNIDAVVGARMLHQLSLWCLASNGKIKMKS